MRADVSECIVYIYVDIQVWYYVCTILEDLLTVYALFPTPTPEDVGMPGILV